MHERRSRVAEMLGDFRANLTKVLEAHREAGRKDGTHIIANAAGDNSSDADEGTGVSHGTIAALVSVAGFAVAAVVRQLRHCFGLFLECFQLYATHTRAV